MEAEGRGGSGGRRRRSGKEESWKEKERTRKGDGVSATRRGDGVSMSKVLRYLFASRVALTSQPNRQLDARRLLKVPKVPDLLERGCAHVQHNVRAQVRREAGDEFVV